MSKNKEDTLVYLAKENLRKSANQVRFVLYE